MWPREPQIFTIWLFTEEAAYLCILCSKTWSPKAKKGQLAVIIVEIPFLSLQATHFFQKLIFIFLIHIHRTLLILYYAHFLYPNDITQLLHKGISRSFKLLGFRDSNLCGKGAGTDLGTAFAQQAHGIYFGDILVRFGSWQSKLGGGWGPEYSQASS